MRLYLDTEFNGFRGDLISLALVPADGGENFYQAVPWPAIVEPWVVEHVLPKLGIDPVGPNEFRAMFHSYVRRFESPTIVCDWHADASHFCDMLAGTDYGSSLDYQCMIQS